MLAVSSSHLAFVEHALLAAMAPLIAVPTALGFVLRPSSVALLFLAGGANTRVRLVLALNLASITIALGVVQVGAWQRALLPDVGFALLWIAAATEILNAWALQSTKGDEASPRLVHLAAAVAFVAVAMHPAVRTNEHRDVTIWWPADARQEFASVQQGYGWQNVGHFGELPLILRRLGYSVTLRGDLERVAGNIIVVPVPIRPLRATEIEALRAAAARGSRVLLIAEHTNLDGVRDSFNAVLEGTGLELGFDTTNGIFGDTAMSLSGPLAKASRHLTHNRGASVGVRGPGPVVLLRGGWWHSDLGDPLAPERGYLSDYRVSPGDRFGNLVLAARVRLGRGEVFLWGDGSPFLNQNIAYNSQFLIALMSQVAGKERLPWIGPAAAGLLLLLWQITRRREVVGILLAVSLALPYGVGLKAQQPPELVVISDQESNGFDRDPFSLNGVTGLGVGLTRAGFVPSIMPWSSLEEPPRGVFVINPNRAVTNRYARRLSELASSGTTVVISGAGDNRTFRALAAFFGSSSAGPPLGSLSGTDFTTYSAWRLDSTQGQRLNAQGVDVGTVIAVGRGRIVLIADSGFFLSRNLEGETHFDPKNLAFVNTLISPQ